MADTAELVKDVLGPGEAALAEITDDPIFIPYKLVPKGNGKTDKVPFDGKRNLSYSEPADLRTFATAIELASGNEHIDGIGLVFQGGIVRDGWQLIGLDFDGVLDVDNFPLPVRSYAEVSPSGKGIHQYCWAPVEWASRFKNTGSIKLAGCDHAEVYIATSYLTLTGNKINTLCISRLHSEDLRMLERWKLKPAVKPCGERPSAPELDVGTELDLQRFNLSIDQRHLLAGTGQINRSDVSHGLIIKLIDSGASQANILATIVKQPHWWQMMLDHRGDNPDRALTFAKEEIQRAYLQSITGRKANLISFNRKEPEQPLAQVDPVSSKSYPPPFPGPMTEAVAACLEAARKPQPILALGAALSVMAAACGAFYMHQDGGCLNLYTLVVARTGAGKDAALRSAKHSGRKSKAKMVGKPASGQGLEDALTSNVATYCVVDEIAHFFTLMNGANAKSYELANASMILELWSAGRDAHHTREKVGKDAKVIQHPAFNLLGFTTPEKLGNAFTPDDFADGLAGRIYFFISDDDPKARRVKKPMELPASFERVLEEVGRGLVRMLISGTVIGLTDDADALIDVLLDEFDEQSRTTDSPYDRALCSRSMEKLERVAGVLAVWDNPAKPTITTAHLQWAAQLTRASNAAVLGFVDEYIHGGVEQDNAARLLRMIRDGKTKPRQKNEADACKVGLTPRSALMRRSKMDVQSFDRAVRYLQEREEVEVGKFEGTDLQVLIVKGAE